MKRLILFLAVAVSCMGQGLTLRSPLRDISPASGFSYNAITNGMVAYWKMEEQNLSRTDSFGANTLVQVDGTVDITTGIILNSPAFAGTGFLSIADNAELSFGNEDFTLVLWMNLTQTNRVSGLVSKWSGASGDIEYLSYWNQGQLFFHIGNGGAVLFTNIITTTPIAPSTWYFVCNQYDAAGQSVSISVNNGSVASVTYTHGLGNGTNNVFVGNLFNEGTGVYTPRGTVDEVGLWKRKLNAAEITALYNAGVGRTCCPFVQ